MASSLPFSLLTLLFVITAIPCFSEVIFEEGYTVETVLDFNNKKIEDREIFPFSLQPLPQGLVLLDSVKSAFFTIALPLSLESDVRLLSGDGKEGFSDGDLGTAEFNHPRSFAVDSVGNIYVAQRSDNTIRKISKKGVTTIAGGSGSPPKPGHADGPGQNATFSNDFDLVFIPNMCSLLVSDKASRLVRQINLKPEDCAQPTQSELGMASISIIAAICLMCLLIGLIAGFMARRFIVSHEGLTRLWFSKTWKRFLIQLGSQAPITFFDIRSAAAKSPFYKLLGRVVGLSISQFSLMFRIPRVRESPKRVEISLMDSDVDSHVSVNSQTPADPLADLMNFDGAMDGFIVERESPSRTILERDSIEVGSERLQSASYNKPKIAKVIEESISKFDDEAKDGVCSERNLSSSSLVSRRSKVGR
ncbi:uncharacterized protein LOC18427531 isoform X1 [Amborella trichopoda]|uniref:uncharacterized protein LOC18427531 isoform X1 n=1 Tax=Amborella trichopoda TaxID=13333 RepID=UPI0005D3C236|nr:uncharacterized protein LOC18427531 isoform X1 [Amborella trichopoda]|eukprot:XP_011620889.1 uncharacterized protein LOC18427531 isoform X1 [Amborella trichopoda]